MPDLRHRHHDVGSDGSLVGQAVTPSAAGGVDVAAVEGRVGPGEVDELEDAQACGSAASKGEWLRTPAVIDDDHLARRDVADERWRR